MPTKTNRGDSRGEHFRITQPFFRFFSVCTFAVFPAKTPLAKEIVFEYIVLYANPAKKCNFFCRV